MQILTVGAGATGGYFGALLVDRGQAHGVPTPLLAAAVTALRINNNRLAGSAVWPPALSGP